MAPALRLRRSFTRRVGSGVALALIVAFVTGCVAEPAGGSRPGGGDAVSSAAGVVAGISSGTPGETTRVLADAADAAFDEHHLGSLLAQIRVDGTLVAQYSRGEAMGGEPITQDGRFRNGAVAIMYVSATLLRMAEDGLIDLDAPIAQWAPELPYADTTTPRMLAQMTSGMPDHVQNPEFLAALNADPFRDVTRDEVLESSAELGHWFEPGTNWGYSHAGYFALGLVLERAGRAPLDELISHYVLDPLGLTETVADQSPAVPEPVVHAFTAERGVWEDATYWNPSWTLPPGAVETTTIGDMAESFEQIIGRGAVLEPASLEDMLTPPPAGFGSSLEGCPTCHTLTPEFSYGLGVFLENDWVMQTPLFAGYLSAVATLPPDRNDGHSVTIAVAATMTEQSVTDWTGTLPNRATQLVDELAATLVPEAVAPVFHGPAD
ncbi:beta-lactamase family protein [Herbiconiux moechotypicola]|uniref:Serine hydrolase domain-containing protein n=1 Tax=Herbiconiux moechotypicola TaxID=637393 RepID=A0ABP5QIB5_9MICO|nr:serine hydrolase domain-containing protein [Herbiconiux moechotypicola]MCS5729937.1 beta-lactamase family protein [Herbiconiux moechotypicola]